MLLDIFGAPRLNVSDLFRRKRPISSTAEFEDFLDANAAFVVQKAIFEYSRAAAGYLWQPLFSESAFKQALERSRWLAFPRGVVLAGEVVEAVLRPHAKGDAGAMLAGVCIAVERVFERHSTPDLVGDEDWKTLRRQSLSALRALQVRPPRAVKDMAGGIAAEIFAILPVHEKVRGRDPILLENNLVASLLAVHADFERRANLPKLLTAIVPRS